jgi:hypothetical protein
VQLDRAGGFIFSLMAISMDWVGLMISTSGEREVSEVDGDASRDGYPNLVHTLPEHDAAFGNRPRAVVSWRWLRNGRTYGFFNTFNQHFA